MSTTIELGDKRHYSRSNDVVYRSIQESAKQVIS
jgi:hypothetical protein